MSMRTQFRNLLQQGAALRQDVFGGGVCVYEGSEVEGAYWSAVRGAKKLEDGGFQLDHDSILRWPKSGPKPELNRIVTLEDANYRISEIRDGLYEYEWIMGLRSITA